MGIFSNLVGRVTSAFSGNPFLQVMRGFARALDWHIEEVNERRVRIPFENDDGRHGLVAVMAGDPTSTIAAYPDATFPLSGLPAAVSEGLLKRNLGLSYGHWEAFESKERTALAVVYRANLQQLDPPTFKHVCLSLLAEADALDEFLDEQGRRNR